MAKDNKSILIKEKTFKVITLGFANGTTDEQKIEMDDIAFSSIILNLSEIGINKCGKVEKTKDLWEILEEIYFEKNLK